MTSDSAVGCSLINNDMAVGPADRTHAKWIHLLEFTRSTEEFRACLAEVPALQQCLSHVAHAGHNVDFKRNTAKIYLEPELVEPTRVKLQSQSAILRRSYDDVELQTVMWEDLRSRHVICSVTYIMDVLNATGRLRKSLSIKVKRHCMIDVRSQPRDPLPLIQVFGWQYPSQMGLAGWASCPEFSLFSRAPYLWDIVVPTTIIDEDASDMQIQFQ